MQTIIELWKKQPGKFFCVSTKNAMGRWKDNFFKRSELGDVREFLKDNSDKDIYWCVCGLTHPQRRKEFVELPKMLWADLDEANPHKMRPKPTIAIESSPGRWVGLWLTDQVVTESINKRLTSLVGADPAGYDVTQVLRIPGTTNYKYQSNPRVRELWDDGPTWRLRDIEKMLPEDEEDDEMGEGAATIFKKYEKSLPAQTRHELMSGKPTPGKRSEVLWRLENDLIEAGVSREEAFILLKASPWNKFRGRAGEDDQLNRELDKVYAKKFKGKKWKEEETPAHKNGYTFLATNMDDVEEENINWLWFPYLARGEVTIIEGDPGVGKSYLCQMVAKGLVDGDRMPSVKKEMTRHVKGKVAYFDIENTAATVTKKRLKYNGCKNMGDFYQEEEPFSIDDAPALGHVYEAIEKLKPVAVFFDTVNLYIGKADTHKSSETTQALAVFKDIARRFDCSVVIVRHLTKGNAGVSALYRGQGSIAFTGVSRIVMTVGTDPEDAEIKVVSVTKLNLAKRPQALTFTIDALPDTLKENDRSRFAWGGFVNLSSDEILATSKGGGNHERDGAIEFLKRELEDGAVKVGELEVMAEKRSISRRTLYRASEELGVKKKLTGYGKGRTSTWKLAFKGKK
jgi:KaiC/GvpD/RAD55 family RecA-like ATPase